MMTKKIFNDAWSSKSFQDKAAQIRDDDEYLKIFIKETANILYEVEELCLELENKGNDKKIISKFFGLIHTIKGSSGFLVARDFHEFLHHFEDLLNQIQNGERGVTKNTISICLNAIDICKKFVHDFKMGTPREDEIENLTKIFNYTDENNKVQVSSIIKSISRIIKSTSADLNKKVEFIVEGDELKLDKSIADIISKSLVHMVRNSIDHGIEDGFYRLEKKKPLAGKLLLKLTQDLEFVKVELNDDGAGINIEKIKEKILQKNIRTSQELANMTIADLYAIIFESGFSTAQAITAVSGRGMGMSMVKECVENVGGEIIINSKKDEGSHFILMIPIRKSGLSI